MKIHLLWAVILLVSVLIIGCNSRAPTPSPTPLPTATSIPTPSPTPLPTPTPIPGYVGGEETEAYNSFMAYYQEIASYCHSSPDFYVEATIDKKYSGKAIYVGDGIWRIYIKIITKMGVWIGEDEWFFHEPEELERMFEVRSFPDRTWDYTCTWDRPDPWEDIEDPRDYLYYPEYDDPRDDYYPEPPEDWEEPPEREQEWP